MRVFTIILFFLSLNQSLYSQDQNPTISISYKNINQIDVLKKIEASTNFKFYFQEEWFEKNVLISGDYSNKTIQEILSQIFKETNLNFFY